MRRKQTSSPWLKGPAPFLLIGNTLEVKVSISSDTKLSCSSNGVDNNGDSNNDDVDNDDDDFTNNNKLIYLVSVSE